MDIVITKLRPDLAEDYVRFFDITPHDDHTAKDELPCCCVTWRSDDSYAENNHHWFSAREERRERAIQFIRAESLQGYLAYYGDKIVGWCNANANCRLCGDYLRSYWPIDEYNASVKIKSIFCFTVAPEVQRRGVATQLLKRVCTDAAADGFDFVEAYAHENFYAEHPCRGPLAMYEKCGFIKHAEREGRIVVRKSLTQ